MRLSPLALLALATPALAQDPEIQFGGVVQSDIRFPLKGSILGSPTSEWYAPKLYEGPGIARDQLLLKAKIYAKAGKFGAKADVDLVLPGLTDGFRDMGDLTRRWNAVPVYFEANSLYVEAYGLLPNVDLRVGNQVVDWGAGDRFNPTNTLNPKDLEDVLLFGELQGTLMARLDYTPAWWLTFSGFYVPVFRPALLPLTAPLGLAAVDRVPALDDELRWRIHAETAVAERVFATPTVVTGTNVIVPDPHPRNSQFAFRVGALAGPIDVAVSYYRGFSDTPVPVLNKATQVVGEQCNPSDEDDCIDGMLATEVTLGFPRMQVIGLNLSGEANPLGFIHESIKPFGFRVEAGLFLPEETRMRIEQSAVVFDFNGLVVERPEGEYAYPDGEPPVVLDKRPFAKWVVGIDYTFNRHTYMNVMWVHGFPGEFGAGDWISPGDVVLKAGVNSADSATLGCALAEDGTQCAVEILHPRLGDYLVGGLDFKMLPSQKMTLRLFGIVDLSGGTFTRWSETAEERVSERLSPFDRRVASGVVYPEVQYNFGNGLEIHGGVLLQMGRPWTKFGDPQNGGSMVFTRTKYSF